MPRKTKRPTADEFRQLQLAANAGDAGSLKRIREILRDFPDICRTLGNLSQRAEWELIQRFNCGDLAVTDAIKLQLATKRDELGYGQASALERLCIERVVITWAQCQLCLMELAKAEPGSPESYFWLDWELKAHKMHDRSLRSMRDLKRLWPHCAAVSFMQCTEQLSNADDNSDARPRNSANRKKFRSAKFANV